MIAPTNTLDAERTGRWAPASRAKQEVEGPEASGARPSTPLNAEVEPCPRGSLGNPADAPSSAGSPTTPCPGVVGPTTHTGLTAVVHEPAAQRDVHDIRHGYNLADLDQLARAAVRVGARTGVTSAAELYDSAWSAIAERLCTADEPPARTDLIGAGMSAISDAVWAAERCHGWDRQAHDIRPSFATYWIDHAGPTPSPERAVIDRTALWQIWASGPLTDGQRQALLALATYRDYQLAADSLGLPYKTFHQRVRYARQAFLTAWHEGETPSKVWAADRRRWRDGQPVKQRRLADHATIKATRGATSGTASGELVSA